MNLPIVLSTSVKNEWIDYNNHMGDFAYTIAFSDALDPVLDVIGLNEKYRETTDCTIFTLESHISFLREIKLGDEISIDFQLVDFDHKRIHVILSLKNRARDVCAYFEVMLMHMRSEPGGRRKPAAFPASVSCRLEELAKAHQKVSRPNKVGASIGIRHRTP